MKLATKQRAIDQLRLISDSISFAYGTTRHMDLPYIGGPSVVGLDEWRTLYSHINDAKTALEQLRAKLEAITDDQPVIHCSDPAKLRKVCVKTPPPKP